MEPFCGSIRNQGRASMGEREERGERLREKRGESDKV